MISWLRSFSYPGEGWGITTNGRLIFMSDGSPEIHILDSSTFLEKRRLKVRDGSAPVAQLNELEFVEGEIFANVWQTDRIARISPQTGAVVGWIDLTGLLSAVQRTDPDAVLNGIAYDPQAKRLFYRQIVAGDLRDPTCAKASALKPEILSYPSSAEIFPCSSCHLPLA